MEIVKVKPVLNFEGHFLFDEWSIVTHDYFTDSILT